MARDGISDRTNAKRLKVDKPVVPEGLASSSAGQITSGLIQHIGRIAEDCGANAILVYVDALSQTQLRLPQNLTQRVYYVTKTPHERKEHTREGHKIIQVPNVALTRMGQVKIAVLLGLSRGLLNRDDIIVFLSGLSGSGSLDTIIVIDVGREFEMFLAPHGGEEMAPHILPEVLERVIDIAAELGSEGREGKPIGALFVIGDVGHVLRLSRQLILNPFRGYPEEERNILDPALEETVKELATIDGAFIIRGNGIIESAGAYVKTTGQDQFKLPQGLGVRHHAAAAITTVSEAVAVTVSESTGTVTIFRNGRIITEIEKPRSTSLGRYL
ncbi:MAG: DNA integrity scanning protein DisA nucleotide-binding domain protein [Candidatus Binatia bacterium]